MKARRIKSRRRHKGRVSDVEAEVDRRLGAILAIIRREFGNTGPTFADAIRSLHDQLAERGDTSGRLRDVQCHLDETGMGALLYANWESDDPVFARFVLPAQTTEDEFDAAAYVRLVEG